MSNWNEDKAQGIQSLKEIEESLAAFTAAFKERAGEYRSAMSAIDDKIAEMDTVLKEGCKTLEDKVKAVAESVHVFDQAKEVAIQWQEKALAAKEDLEKAMSLATSNFDGIAESLMSLKEAYDATLKIKQEVLPEIKKAAEKMKTAVVHGVGTGGSTDSVAGESNRLRTEIAELKSEVGELKQVVREFLTKYRDGETQTRPMSVEANRELAEKFGDSCKALLELVADKYGVSGE
jgi:chromosome segregation ATPase